jgi:hypothetical protein
MVVSIKKGNAIFIQMDFKFLWMLFGLVRLPLLSAQHMPKSIHNPNYRNALLQVTIKFA